jgi:hypothetical protein
MGRVWAVVLIAFTGLTALAAPSPASAYAPGTSSDFFGVNGAMLRNFVSPDKAASLDGLATSMGQQGISWARLTFAQSVEEPNRGTFNWYVTDTMIAALARHGVRGAASFVGTAYWDADPALLSTCGWRAAPYDVAGWKQWVAAAVNRYGANGTFWASHPELPNLPIRTWEIGNEVNSASFWCPAANPEQYADVYAASAATITSADSSSKVIVAGLVPRFGPQNTGNLDVPAFLSRMISARPSLAGSIPAVAIHPYAPTATDALRVVAQFRQAMRDAGLANTPMIANEIGWYTQGPPDPLLMTDAQRATQIAAVANQFWRTDCGLQGLAPYSWITLQQNPMDSEHWYGLADPTTGAPNLSGLAYGEQIHQALGQTSTPPSQTRLHICGGKTLTVEKSGSGTVTGSPGEISCGSDCSQVLDAGTTVSLSASPAPGFHLASWSGCDSVNSGQCHITLDGDSTVSATFAPLDPPDTRITAFKVAKRGRSFSYRYDGDQGTGALTFSCRIDNRPFQTCLGQAMRTRPGTHTFQVAATDELGRTDPTPASRTFRIRRR